MKRNLILWTVAALVLLSPGFLAAGGMPMETTDSTPAEKYFKAVRSGDAAGAKSFLDSKQVVIGQQDAEGNTGLHIAVAQSDVNMVLALLVYKPDPQIKNTQGQTVMDKAKEKGNAQITLALQQAGF